MEGSSEAAVTALLEAAKEAHAPVDDDDHFWGDWYAAYLEDRIAPYLGGRVDRDTLSSWLAQAEAAHQREAPESPWPPFYARFLLDVAGLRDR